MIKNKIAHFFVNVLMYLTLLIGMYFLYNPHNKHAANNPHSDFSFIYAQF